MVVSQIKTKYKEEGTFIVNSNMLVNDDYNSFKMLVFLAKRIVFLALCWRYYDKVSAAVLALPWQ